MSKHYPAIIILFIVSVTFGLSVNLSSPALFSGHWASWPVSAALAEDGDSHDYGSDGYDRDGYDRDGHDRDGYDREGYSDDGHDHDGHYDAEHDRGSQAGSSTPSFKAKPTVKQY